MSDVLTQEVPSRLPEILRRTVPWVRFMAVLLFLTAGLMIIGGLFMGLGLALGGAATEQMGGAIPGLMLGIVYAGVGALNLLPASFLWRFASRSDGYVSAPSSHRLEQALDAQRAYWKFMGVFAIVCFGVACLAVVAAIIGAAMFTAR